MYILPSFLENIPKLNIQSSAMLGSQSLRGTEKHFDKNVQMVDLYTKYFNYFRKATLNYIWEYMCRKVILAVAGLVVTFTEKTVKEDGTCF